MSLLEDIVASKQREVEALKDTWDSDFTSRRAPQNVAALLARKPGAPLRLLAEVKFKSPSAGPLSKSLDAGARARAYAEAGASMVSVLCDGPFFAGSWNDLESAALALQAAKRDVPLLAKEFIIDEVQLSVARAKGADAALLIVRILGAERLKTMVRAAQRRGLEPLVEVANEAELSHALATSARLIGVNARDLDTLAMDSAHAARIVASIPRDRVAIHLSGIKTEADVAEIAKGRADAALVGERLMREDDPAPLLRSFVAAAGASSLAG